MYKKTKNNKAKDTPKSGKSKKKQKNKQPRNQDIQEDPTT